MVQTAVLFCLILAGLRIAGRRVFAERSPQDLVIIVMVGEASNVGLSDQGAGFWGAVASVVTLLILGAMTERFIFLRHLFNRPPVRIYSDNTLDRKAMEKSLLDESDLNEAARQSGFDSYESFKTIVLEGDGRISGIVKNKEN